jgi:PadR family transcriptional regulator, regulatory protein PadR
MARAREDKDDREREDRDDDKQSSLVQGTLHMLILKTLALEPMHGYGIGVRLEQISRGVFQVNAGSLFPALRRLERAGLIEGDWQTTENNRRAKYYSLTAEGRGKLKSETRDWKVQAMAITRILDASRGEL